MRERGLKGRENRRKRERRIGKQSENDTTKHKDIHFHLHVYFRSFKLDYTHKRLTERFFI